MEEDIYIHCTATSGQGDLHTAVKHTVTKQELKAVLMQIILALKLTPSDITELLDEWIVYLHTH